MVAGSLFTAFSGSDSGILADDLTGNGFLELVIATATGSVHALSTNIPYHPLNIW